MIHDQLIPYVLTEFLVRNFYSIAESEKGQADARVSAHVYIFRFGLVLLTTGRFIPSVGTPGSSYHGHEAHPYPAPSSSLLSKVIFTSIQVAKFRFS